MDLLMTREQEEQTMTIAATQTRAPGSKGSARPAWLSLKARPFAAAREKTEAPRSTAQGEPAQGEPAHAAAGPSFSFGRLALQPKLAIGRSDDPSEREADHVAERVMRMPEPSAAHGLLQRKCASCEEEDKVQRKTSGNSMNGAAPPPVVHDVLRTPGQPLDVSTRGFMERRFGYDFGDVRIHTEALASQSAEAVAARAYTVGSNIAFRQGEYAPGTTAGKSLLAHELAHVVQQGSGGVRPSSSSFRPSEARDATIQRQTEDEIEPSAEAE
jgi:hypothetical protein